MKAQEWLEKNYPNMKTETIYLNQTLEGILDCSEDNTSFTKQESSTQAQIEIPPKNKNYSYESLELNHLLSNKGKHCFVCAKEM